MQAEVRKLAASNEDLAQRLESAQQRLELAISRSQHASAQPRPAPAAQVVSLVYLTDSICAPNMFSRHELVINCTWHGASHHSVGTRSAVD